MASLSSATRSTAALIVVVHTSSNPVGDANASESTTDPANTAPIVAVAVISA